VTESTETLARCAVLSQYGVSEDEVVEMVRSDLPGRGLAIYPDNDFEVSPMY
jgi:hypothetical protein